MMFWQYGHDDQVILSARAGPAWATRAEEAAIKWWESRPPPEWWGVRIWQELGGRPRREYTTVWRRREVYPGKYKLSLSLRIIATPPLPPSLPAASYHDQSQLINNKTAKYFTQFTNYQILLSTRELTSKTLELYVTQPLCFPFNFTFYQVGLDNSIHFVGST